MLCKVQKPQRREACGKEPDTRRSTLACIVEAYESTRKRLERTLPEDHEERIVGKGFNSLSHYNPVHKFLSMPQAMKIPDAKSSSGQRMGKARKTAGMANDHSQ